VNEAVDNANASTNQGDQHKAENQLIISNSTDKFANPRNGRSDPATDIGKHSRDRISGDSSLKNHTFQKNYLIFIKRTTSPIMAKEKKKPTK
jgi:hypothetical protein